MGKKGKARKKPAAVKVPEPPFLFRVDNFSEDKGECALHIYDNTDVHFQEIEIEVRVSKDPDTGKAAYDLKVVKTKEERRPPGVYAAVELLPFPIYNLETATMLTVEPARTGGRPPFLMTNPETKAETVIEPPYFIHYELSNRKRYLLDLRKFVNGLFKFKDPESKEDIMVDITKRVDPLNGAPLYGVYENPARVFVEAISKGEAYIVKDPETEKIEIIDVNGDPVEGYSTFYDPFENKTTILDEEGNVVGEMEGQHRMYEEDSFMENQSEQDELELGVITFNRSAVEAGLRNSEGDRGTVGQYKSIGTTPKQDLGVLEKDLGSALSEQFGLYSPSEYHIAIDPVTQAKLFVDRNERPIATEKYNLEMDPLSGTIRIVDHKGNPVDIGDFSEQDAAEILVQLPDGFHFSQDIDRNQIELVSPSGDILKFNPKTNERLPTVSDKKGIKIVKRQETTAFPPKRSTTVRPKLPIIVQDHKRNPTEERYFESMRLEESWTILGQANELPKEKAQQLLQTLIDTIEREKEFVKNAMRSKLNEEKMYVETLIREKWVRQKEFITDMMNRHTNPYDRTELQIETLAKLDRENQHVFDQLDEKIDAENSLLNETLLRELRSHKASLVKKTNLTCYQAVKGIMYKQMSLKLERERELIKKELCNSFAIEGEEILKHLMHTRLPIEERSCEPRNNVQSPTRDTRGSVYKYFQEEIAKEPQYFKEKSVSNDLLDLDLSCNQGELKLRDFFQRKPNEERTRVTVVKSKFEKESAIPADLSDSQREPKFLKKFPVDKPPEEIVVKPKNEKESAMKSTPQKNSEVNALDNVETIRTKTKSPEKRVSFNDKRNK